MEIVRQFLPEIYIINTLRMYCFPLYALGIDQPGPTTHPSNCLPSHGLGWCYSCSCHGAGHQHNACNWSVLQANVLKLLTLASE